MIERSLEIGEHPVGGSAPPAHRFGVLAVELSHVCFGSGAGAPAPWPLRDRMMPIEQTPGGELDREHVAELGEDILARNALDAIGGLTAATTVVLEIVRH